MARGYANQLAFRRIIPLSKGGRNNDSKEVDTLLTGLNRSSERLQTLWFTFLTLTVYLSISAWNTTDKMLFLESQLTLPLLNVPLPLVSFYILAPLSYMLIHFYMLLNLVLLARTAGVLEKCIEKIVTGDPHGDEIVRAKVENILFLQILVGDRSEREGVNSIYLNAIAFLTIVVTPVLLLMMFQANFLPYHNEIVSWIHRSIIFIDLILICLLWPAYMNNWGRYKAPTLRIRGITSTLATTFIVFWCLGLAVYPDEHLYVWRANLLRLFELNDSNLTAEKASIPRLIALLSPHNTLDLRGEDLINMATLNDIKDRNENHTYLQRWLPVLSLSGRDLTGANLDFTDIRHVDFSYATLNRVRMNLSLVSQSNFRGASLKEASLVGAQVQRVAFSGTAMQNSNFWRADLRGSGLVDVDLSQANLEGAQLQGANVFRSILTASSLRNANMEGTLFRNSHLEGVFFDGSTIDGAVFDEIDLHASSFRKAKLKNTLIKNVIVWNSDLHESVDQSSRVSRAVNLPLKHCRIDDRYIEQVLDRYGCEWSEADDMILRSKIVGRLIYAENAKPSKSARKSVKLTLALDRNRQSQIWEELDRNSPTADKFDQILADAWIRIGCASNVPYVIRSFTEFMHLPDEIDTDYNSGRYGYDVVRKYTPFSDAHTTMPKLAKAYLDKGCSGNRDLYEFTIRFLRTLAD